MQRPGTVEADLDEGLMAGELSRLRLIGRRCALLAGVLCETESACHDDQRSVVPAEDASAGSSRMARHSGTIPLNPMVKLPPHKPAGGVLWPVHEQADPVRLTRSCPPPNMRSRGTS